MCLRFKQVATVTNITSYLLHEHYRDKHFFVTFPLAAMPMDYIGHIWQSVNKATARKTSTSNKGWNPPLLWLELQNLHRPKQQERPQSLLLLQTMRRDNNCPKFPTIPVVITCWSLLTDYSRLCHGKPTPIWQ